MIYTEDYKKCIYTYFNINYFTKIDSTMSDQRKLNKLISFPQYKNSETFMLRWLDSIQAKEEIFRSPNIRGLKGIDESEFKHDIFSYFVDNRLKMENEFYNELKIKIGEEKTIKFCSIIREEWTDGKSKRMKGNILNLKFSIKNYLSKIIDSKKYSLADLVINPDLGTDYFAEFDEFDIAKILTLNDQMMVRHLDAWKSLHPKFRFEGNNLNIYLRRGLHLKNKLEEDKPYREMDFISSYSIAISVTEKFSQLSHESTPSIINADFDLFKGRILFFSPFIKGKTEDYPEQLEFGIIPSEKPLLIKLQGENGGIYDYILAENHEEIKFFTERSY